MVNESQRSRAPIQRLADSVAAYFVPLVIVISAASFAVWAMIGPQPRMTFATLNAIAVLIIACPCALGLATPMSIMVGTGRAAKAGILVKNAEMLEVFEKVNTLVLDKTGTLTEGKPSLVSAFALPGWSETEILEIAAGIECGSEHPLAAAIVTGTKDRGVVYTRAEKFRALPGKGVIGTVGPRKVALGNQTLFKQRDIDSTPLNGEAERLKKNGITVVMLAVDERAAGLIGVSDPIKKSAVEAIKEIKSKGLDVIMLTGDTQPTAEAVGKQLGIRDIRAEALPEMKKEIIQELRKEGRIVAMAGDGMNDAAALAAADVGIAMGDGTDVAIESAGITLLKGDLSGIVRARRLSHYTMRNIRQNLFFAFAYNSIGVSVAAGILYPTLGLLLSPIIASLAMTFSSISVISNALRLRKLSL